MKYHNITKDDMNNGPGLRVVLWVAGCSHHCKGCHNPHTWDPNQGEEVKNGFAQELSDQLFKDYIDGITYSGGDPLHENNREFICFLTDWVIKVSPTKTQWLYTGYTYEELRAMDNIYINGILENINVLIDGKYEESLRSPEMQWVGSSNQRVIDVKKSLKEGKVILFK